jgi:hypothetical protein
MLLKGIWREKEEEGEAGTMVPSKETRPVLVEAC